MSKGVGRKIICLLLIGQLAFPVGSVQAFADNPAAFRSLLPRQAGAKPTAPHRPSPTETALANPLLDTLKGFGDLPDDSGISMSDPTLDRDPFFLRSQHWQSATGEAPQSPPVSEDTSEEPPQTAFSADTHGFSLRLREMGREWRVDAPLHPVYFTGDYVVLAANDEKVFEGCPGGEGVFLVRFEELLGAQTEGERVPIYFFPLPDTGWTGAVQALGFPAQSTLVLVDNRGDALPIWEDDIETVITVAKINLNMAMGAGVRSAVLTPAEFRHSADVLPPVGSTAGFGILFTGYDLDHPENSVFHQKRMGWWQRLRRDLNGLVENSAQAETAQEESEEDSAEKIVHNLLRVSVVTGITLIGAVVLKYTLYRQYFEEKHAAEPAPRGSLHQFGRWSADVGDIFAHNLAVLSQFPKVWFGRGVKFWVDRFFPQLNASKNSLVRRFLKETVYYTGEASAHIPVNWNTLVKQFVVMGGIDVASYDIQLYFADRWLSQRLADWIPELQSRQAAAFGTPNAETAYYNRNETIETLTTYLTNPTFAAAQKDYYSTVLIPEVERELRGRGYLPGTPAYDRAAKNLLKEKVDLSLQQDGFPGSKAFLFDAVTLWDFIVKKILGYAPGQGASKERFAGIDSPGLLSPSVKAAHQEVSRRLQQFPNDPALLSANRILEQTERDISFLRGFARYPLQVLIEGLRGRGPPPLTPIAQAVRRVRQNLIALTYDGPMEDLHNIPNPWLTAFGEPGAVVASELFRRSFFRYASDRPTLLSGPSEEARAKVGDGQAQVDEAASRRLLDRYPAEVQKALAENGGREDLARREVEFAHAGELDLLRDGEWTRVVDAVTDSETPYAPPRIGWYRQRQERRAKQHTQEEYLRRHQRPFDPEGASRGERAEWNQIYAEAMMREVALYPDYEAAPGLRQTVENRARSTMNQQMGNAKIHKFLDSLTSEQRVDFAATLYAEHVARAYVDVTVNSGLVAPLSTAQPGRLQWLRQTAFVRKSGMATRVLRTVESLFPEEAHRAGFGAAVYRNVPVLYDFFIGNVRSYRNAVTAALAVYPVNLMLWGIGLPAPMFALSIVTGFFVTTPTAILNRFFHMQGLQPMSSLRNLAFYTVIYSWATFGGAIPTLLFAADFAHLLAVIETVATGGVGGLAMVAGTGLVASVLCTHLFRMLGK